MAMTSLALVDEERLPYWKLKTDDTTDTPTWKYRYQTNITLLLSEILRGYDSLLRPGLGGKPCRVKVNLYFMSFAPINEPQMEYTPTFYFRQYWQDPRLAFGDSIRAEAIRPRGDFTKKIWTPDTFFIDDVTDNVRRVDSMLEISSNGSVSYSISYNDKDLVYEWMKNPPALEFSSQLRMAHYDLIEWSTESKLDEFVTGKYASLTAKFVFKRRVRFYILSAFIPAAFIVILSWVGFWIDERSVPARVSLGITTVLAITTLIFGVQSTLPRVGYIKAIDVYLLGNFLFVFASLVEYAIMCSIFKTNEQKQREEELRERIKANNARKWWEKEMRAKQTAKEAKVPTITKDTRSKRISPTPGSKTQGVPHRPTYWLEVGNLHLRDRKKYQKYHISDRIARVLFPLSYTLFLVFYFIGYMYL
ncbi:gamma-aminobutyric acid receptor subunit beta [Nematostella vectensis]|uniref:gamma-aminobutyric acid receptor subunit beta n=1 Tax=Nematostella vectensis TaxID=45351 RepID=UPI002077147D|nr:gamma-aminobutyric acid receptor subunit beta [Nematostella vectensis]